MLDFLMMILKAVLIIGAIINLAEIGLMIIYDILHLKHKYIRKYEYIKTEKFDGYGIKEFIDKILITISFIAIYYIGYLKGW